MGSDLEPSLVRPRMRATCFDIVLSCQGRNGRSHPRSTADLQDSGLDLQETVIDLP